MPAYKLNYFSAKGAAEPIRFLLSYLGKDFQDKRFNREDWPSIKPSMPFGKVPVLEIDGKQIHQSAAIARFLGKEGKIAGRNNWEALQIDMAVDTIIDFKTAVAAFWSETNEDVKAKKKEVVVKETAPFYLGKLDELVKQNGGYLANGELSWGDLYFISSSDTLIHLLGFDYFQKYPNLKALKEKVVSIPQISAWIAKRPESVY